MKILNKIKFILALLLIILMQFVFMPSSQKTYAATSPSLGTAATYSILAGSSVTNTGASTISGNVGISPGAGGSPNYTGFGTVTLGGSINDANGAALTAMDDRNAAYTALGSQGCDTDYGGVTTDLAGKTLVPGVYCSTSFNLTGTLTLNGGASDVWIFKSASDLVLTGGSAVKVVFTGGGQPCNVWWRVVSTATFDANSTLVGNILALTSITFAAGASLDGRALAQNAEVTLSSNSITGPTCVAATPTPTSTSTSSSSSSSSSSSNGSSSTVCPASTFAPTNNPNLFQIDRAGSTAVLYFTPVNDYLTYYFISYGLSPGDERYGVSFPASLSKGIVNFTINGLNPDTTYYFKVRGGNGCAPGGWSNNKESNSKNPVLPNTGIGPRERSVSLFTVLTGVFLSAGFVYLAQKKRKIPN